MSQKLVECIPNFSEARRPEVIEQIKKAIISVPEVVFLDQSSDTDHNRTVLTFIGSPKGVEEAAFCAIAKAAELIDLNKHTGEHPRIGATDVVPFVPISGITMDECVQIANRLGQRVGEELGIPIYLYEAAATRPERRNLENIRRGEYETLKQEIGVVPERTPDFGPAQLGPAGATVIGARQPLIAYNVYLTTSDVTVAKKIARAVRHSSGGLRYVKALGMLVEGLAQVSMNLTNFHRTPVFRVVEFIRREAARYGVNIHHSELVGLIPQQALVDSAQWYMQMDQFDDDQILEYRMASAQKGAEGSENSEEQKASSFASVFLDQLAAGTPTPGGGSAAAYSAAAGAALVAMVARLTVGKKKYQEVESEMNTLLENAEALRYDLTTAIKQDSDAFDSLMNAFRLPKDTPEQTEKRLSAIQQATLKAAQVPLEVAHKSVDVMELAVSAVEYGNVNAISDGATGAALARAALSGAGYNVRINITGLKDKQIANSMIDQLKSLEKRARQADEKITSYLVERGGLPVL